MTPFPAHNTRRFACQDKNVFALLLLLTWKGAAATNWVWEEEVEVSAHFWVRACEAEEEGKRRAIVILSPSFLHLYLEGGNCWIKGKLAFRKGVDSGIGSFLSWDVLSAPHLWKWSCLGKTFSLNFSDLTWSLMPKIVSDFIHPDNVTLFLSTLAFFYELWKEILDLHAMVGYFLLWKTILRLDAQLNHGIQEELHWQNTSCGILRVKLRSLLLDNK